MKFLSKSLLLASKTSFWVYMEDSWCWWSFSFYSRLLTYLVFLSSSWMACWPSILSLLVNMFSWCWRSCFSLIVLSNSSFINKFSSIVFYLSSFSQAFWVFRFSICCWFNSSFFSRADVRFYAFECYVYRCLFLSVSCLCFTCTSS